MYFFPFFHLLIPLLPANAAFLNLITQEEPLQKFSGHSGHLLKQIHLGINWKNDGYSGDQ